VSSAGADGPAEAGKPLERGEDALERGEDALERGEDALERGEDALERLDLAEACGIWSRLVLTERGPAGRRAAERLDEWLDRCPLASAEDDLLAGLAEQVRSPGGDARTAFRRLSLVRRLAGRYAVPVSEDMATVRLEPLAGRIDRSTAPVLVALSGVPVEAPAGPPAQARPGALQTSRFCFRMKAETAVHVRLELPNPASAWLCGELWAVRDPSAPAGGASETFRTLHLAEGTWCLDVVQAVQVAADPVVDLLPRSAVEAVLPAMSPPDGTGPLQCTSALSIAGLGQRDGETAVAERAAGSPPVEAMPETVYAAEPGCRTLLAEIRAQMDNGEDQAAEGRLLEAAEECRSTADGLLVQADLAQARQWTPLMDEMLEEAYRRHPEDCEVLARWVTRRLERAEIPPAGALAVVCESVERMMGGLSTPVLSADPVSQLRDAGRAQRFKLLPMLLAAGGPDVEQALERLARRDIHVGWLLADWWLARGQGERAQGLAEAISEHPAALAGLRMQVGRLFSWGKSRRHWTDPETVAKSYLESGFAQGMPQVVVLDEAVVVPSHNGWFTQVQTTLVHLVSPDAAESVGEVSLAADEELLMLAVRKGDGSWIGPEEMGQSGAGKDTISLPGLAPGDFVLRRTVREVQSDSAGGCHRIPPFYFGHRDLPVFLSRYVVLHGGTGLEYFLRGDVDVAAFEPGTWEFVRKQVEPVPEEPLCPDPEAGVPLVEVASPCLDWSALRDGVGERALTLCDIPFPFPGQGWTPERIYEAMFRATEMDPSAGLFSRSFSQALAEGSGNGAMALYCAFVQAGLDAHLVAVNSAAAPPLDLARPHLAPFDGTVVYVAGERPTWFDPYDPLSPAGRVRRSYAGRTGLVLTARHPRLFVSLPQAGAIDAWKIRVDAEIDGEGALTGTLGIEGKGQAAAELRRQAEGSPEAGERLAAGVVAQVLPGVHVESLRFDTRGRSALLSVDFARGPGADERFLVLLPPLPARELTQLPERTSILYFPGFYNIDLDIELRTETGRFLVAEGRDRVETRFGSAELRVENRGDRLLVVKRASALPAVVKAQSYSELVQFLSSARRLAGLAVEVTGDNGRD
jgi:hypothetical protein